MPAQRSTASTDPVALLAVNALLPDDLKRLLDAVDDDADLFTREASGWRLGLKDRQLHRMIRVKRPSIQPNIGR